MNNYRLKKDLPHCDAGEIFVWFEEIQRFVQQRHFESISDRHKRGIDSYRIPKKSEYRFGESHVISDLEWFEEIKTERFIFESREELENHIAAWNMEHDTEISNYAYDKAISQAIEVIQSFPFITAGSNQGKSKIYEALNKRYQLLNNLK